MNPFKTGDFVKCINANKGTHGDIYLNESKIYKIQSVYYNQVYLCDVATKSNFDSDRFVLSASKNIQEMSCTEFSNYLRGL